MSVDYVKSYPADHQEIDSVIAGQRVLIFDPVQERFTLSSSIADRFRKVDQSLRNCDLTIIRGRTSRFLDDFEKSKDFLSRLLGGTPLLLCVGSSIGQEVEFFTPKGFTPPTSPFDLNAMRDIELQGIFKRSGAIFSGENYHYVLPSGWHSPKFIRVADALQEATEVARIVDWIVPHLTPDSVVVGDTGSLLPLLLMIRLEAQRLYGWDISVRTVNEYPLEESSLEMALADAEEKVRFKENGSILFLVSVSSSGRLIRRFRTLTRVNNRVLVLCNTGLADDCKDATVLTSIPMERWSPNAEGLCDHCSDSTRIGIDRRTYERVPQLKWKFKTVSNVKAKENAQFWGAVDAANAVDLHVDMEYPGADSGRSRHHGIYLDMVCMAGSEWLRECVKTLAVEKLRNPSHIVIPQHRATAPVAALFGEIFPAVEISYAIDGRLSEATKQALTTLSERDTILVADDALVGGKTLVGLRQEIYGATLRDKPPKVQACVLVARPSSRATLNRVERIYRDNTGVQFFAGQTIFLPASDEANCPWCAERRYLLRILPQLNQPARRTAEGRIEQLTGHLPTPFLLGGEALTEEMKTHNSFFGTLRHKAAFAAACSVVQELRTEMDVDAGSSVREILDLPMVIQCFFDSVFISAILRTCQLRELDFIGQHQAIAAEIESKCHDSNMAGLVAELGWAAVQHKLPIAPVVSLLQRFTEHESIVMLLELLRYAADETELVDVLPLE